jgi:hypothetical protein
LRLSANSIASAADKGLADARYSFDGGPLSLTISTNHSVSDEYATREQLSGNGLREALHALWRPVKVLYFKVLSKTFYRRVLLFERRFDDPDLPVRAGITLMFGELGLTDVETYLDSRAGTYPKRTRDLTRKDIIARFRAGDRCFVAWHQRAIVATSWRSFGQGWSDYLDAGIAMPSDVVYACDEYVDQAVRGRNVSPALTNYIRGCLRREEYQRYVFATLPENLPGLRSNSKTGSGPSGYIGWIGFGRWRRGFVRLLSPQASASRGVRLLFTSRMRTR